MALADPVYIKQHDLEPVIVAYLKQGDDSPMPIEAGDVVNFIFRKRGTSTPQIRDEMEILDGPGGQAMYEWVTGDTDMPGIHDLEFELTRASGKILTIPTGEPADPTDPQPEEIYYQAIVFDDLDNP